MIKCNSFLTQIVWIWKLWARRLLLPLSVFPSSAGFVQCYLVNSKLRINCRILLELLVPVAFEVDGIDQHQDSRTVHHILDQQVLDFTW